MRIDGTWYRTIWRDGPLVRVIDQRALPHRFSILPLASCAEVCEAIRGMTIRGAGLIGAAGGYGMWLAACEARDGHFGDDIRLAAEALKATRPTASNLARAVDRQLAAMLAESSPEAMRRRALMEAEAIADEDAAFCQFVGQHGLELIRALHEQKRRSGCSDCTVHVLTHCNAGWLAFVDYGSALSPVYAAFDAGLPVHVWVDETRPRNQGAALTAFELGAHGVPYHLVADNAGGHLMQHGLVDLVIVGADRVTREGDVANKIGTYLKALAARDNGVPFYAALPSSTFDFSMCDGIAEIPIEERSGDEVLFVQGADASGAEARVRIAPEGAAARNWGFDVTPARLVTGLITERGICGARGEDILRMFPEVGMQASDGVVKFRAVHASRELSPEEQELAKRLDMVRRPLHAAG
ncbi:MAG: S-methyl-5-thioribose-1-phosphate isomerase, partial [Desulfovibrionaceae bacterium]|nr:S-methyl-5-thioribose-1-phosphate isomerase [Desulfovibrionaceae bacterium]